MMSRKDYVALAEASRTSTNEDGETIDKQRLVLKLEAALKADNPRFQGDTFVLACWRQ